MRVMPYRRWEAVAYAKQWAFGRNKRYFDFSELGGDCTNFISQCLYAGTGVMNETETFGWYYHSLARRAPAWTGVPYLYNFLTRKKADAGPFGHEVTLEELQPGDIVQLSFDGRQYGHSLLVVERTGQPGPDGVLISTHSQDAFGRTLSSYRYQKARYIHIDGYRR
jgi:hypothetical protein